MGLHRSSCEWGLIFSFPANNFDGNSLMECDQKILQEMGIKKIGDRVRIFVAIKQIRNKSVANRKQKNMVRGKRGCVG